MGNTIATICYDSVRHQRYHNIIVEMRTSYGLTEARPEYLKCLAGKRCEGAQVMTFLGSDNLLDRFVDDVVAALQKDGATNVTASTRFIRFNSRDVL